MKRLLIYLALLFIFGGNSGYVVSASTSTSILTYDEYVLEKEQINYYVLPNEEVIYAKILAAIKSLEEDVYIPYYGNDGKSIANMYFKVVDEHPELFYMEKAISWIDTFGGIKLTFTYRYSPEDIKIKVTEFEKKVSSLIESLTDSNMSELEKELAFHDYISENTSYGINGIESYTAYGVLMDGVGACEGYSKAMQLLLQRVGIEAIYVSSREMNHGWNIVTIDGETYHLDVTWNNPFTIWGQLTRYKYFNLSDEEMAVDHVWDRTIYPACSSDRFNYFKLLDRYDVYRYRKYFYYTESDKLVKQRIDREEREIVDSDIYDFRLNGSVLSYADYNGKRVSYDLKFDLNEDGSLSIEDVSIILPYYNEVNDYYDLNGDEVIDLYDFVLVNRQLL